MRTRGIRLAGRLALRLIGALWDKDRPLIVQLVATRRCNLACGYCTQYDQVSSPVPIELLRRRVDRLARLGTAVVTVTGGEALLHPQLDELIVHIRRRGMIASLISNGYLLTPERIARLNHAGLEHLQISIDNVEPDEVSKKSLRLLETKLRGLAERAAFPVNINSVLGGGVRSAADALAVARRARELGFTSSVTLMDGCGAAATDRSAELAVYREVKRTGDWTRWLSDRWQDNVAHGRPNDWRCRAGARYLYVDEFGLVHYCSMQRGTPATPLERYGVEHIRREFTTRKDCAPYCTLNCVHQASLLDGWRSPQGAVAGTVGAEGVVSG
jgi:MoaA/NifB/PqqE/SkfB family radical SAM enzyme